MPCDIARSAAACASEEAAKYEQSDGSAADCRTGRSRPSRTPCLTDRSPTSGAYVAQADRRSARSTRPPSMGNAGIMLNRARKRLTTVNRSASANLPLSTAANWVGSAWLPVSTSNTTAIATFTAGPASAISNSWIGSSGMRASRATPPIGSNVTSGVSMP